MDKIRLTNGSEYDVLMVGIGSTFSAQLNTEKSLSEIAVEFDNPENTKSIIYVFGDAEEECRNFTSLTIVQRLSPGVYLVLLERSESND